MQSKNIVLQVADETAEIMEEISGQLFDETEARFDEVSASIKESVEKIEKLYSDFSGYTSNSDKQASDNHAEILKKIAAISESLDKLKSKGDGQAAELNEKYNRLSEIMADVPQLIQGVAQEVSGAAETTKEIKSSVLEEIKSISENLARIQTVQTSISEKLDSDDDKKMAEAMTKLSEIEKKIQTVTSTLGNISNSLSGYSSAMERIAIYTSDLKNNNEVILMTGKKNTDLIKDLSQQNESDAKSLEEKLDDVLGKLDAVSQALGELAGQQSEMLIKQSELEKDVQYLKLPFYKKWFAKG